MNIFAVIKGISSAWQLWKSIRKRLPKEVRQMASEAVESAATLNHLPDHHARREYAVSILMRSGMKENTARLAVEAAVAAVKHKEK